MDDDELDEDDVLVPVVDMLDEGCLVLGVVEIVHYLAPDGQDLVMYRACDPNGEPLPIVQTLGLLRLTEDTAMRDRTEA